MRLLRLSAVTLAVATAALGQDLVAVAPNNAKVEYEDARVRVVRLKIAPHESLPMHDRPARVVIALTANDVQLTTPDGKVHTTQVPAGHIAWSGAGKRSVTNLDQPLENIVVEMKNASDAAKPVTHSPSRDDPRALVEPHHQWLFENQYVRVYDVRVPAGATTEFHTHAYDTAIVLLSDEVETEQAPGGSWTKPETSKAGQFFFAADAKKARIHRVRNAGDKEFRVVLVQAK